ncbi:hypothetical protein AGABI2DRAFT_53101, partial [Agaricus bisporus var. bisporus H97]|uniref:hypothetical protein n=1 Tax=Agaricus bisporus var. bisporus (strain H97 / ATCC MYA-4626 / FGSC 10389) TaxID=936046 RepID=UPI00029F668E
DLSTRRVYTSHLKSYMHFISSHKLGPEPNETTLSLFIVYMSEFIKPSSVESYLTGIVHYLAPVYPHIHDWRSAPVVQQTLRGCKKLHNIPIKRKRALTIHELNRMSTLYYYSKQHDDTLFVAILLVGFYALLRLGELVYPDDPTLDCPRKMSQRNTLSITAASVRFQLPYHKADKFYEGNTVLNGISLDIIQALGRWSSEAFRTYIRLHPALL